MLIDNSSVKRNVVESAQQLQILVSTPKEKPVSSESKITESLWENQTIPEEYKKEIKERCKVFNSFLKNISLPYLESKKLKDTPPYKETSKQRDQISYQEQKNASPCQNQLEITTTLIPTKKNKTPNSEKAYVSDIEIDKFIDGLTIESVFGKSLCDL